jgi:transposase
MLGVSNGVVHGYVRRARLAGLTWPLPEGMDDEVRVPTKPAMHSNLKPAGYSDRKPTTLGVNRMG